MNVSHMLRGAGLLVCLCGALVGCETTHTTTVDAPESPPLYFQSAFYSPFGAGGEMTPWAEEAVRLGIGLPTTVGAAPFPTDRVADLEARLDRLEPLEPRERDHQRALIVADYAAGLLGGWGNIDAGTFYSFDSAQALALHIQQYRQHPRYAEILAAMAMLHPDVRGTDLMAGSS